MTLQWGTRPRIPTARGVESAVARLADRIGRPIDWVLDELAAAYENTGGRQAEPGRPKRDERWRQYSPSGSGVFVVVKTDSTGYEIVLFVDRQPGGGQA